MTSWLETLHQAQAKATSRHDIDPWTSRLERVRGKVDYDGLERVSSQVVLDLLQVPQCNRKAGTYRRLARVMRELGWAPVRVRDFAGGGYLEQIRGYCRDARDRHPVHYS